MPVPPQRQAAALSCRTPVVLKAFCFGATSGILATFCFLLIITSLPSSAEGRNRTDATALDDGETRFVHASSCDVFQESTKTREASGPVRFRVEMVRVVDGDTIRVIWHGENLSVRLLGISAPERRHPGGAESTECLRALLAGADAIDLEFENDAPQRDSLGRLLAYVWRADSLLNLEMVKLGHAGLYKGGGKGKYGDALRLAARNHAK